jgi:hypothetical protein
MKKFWGMKLKAKEPKKSWMAFIAFLVFAVVGIAGSQSVYIAILLTLMMGLSFIFDFACQFEEKATRRLLGIGLLIPFLTCLYLALPWIHN